MNGCIDVSRWRRSGGRGMRRPGQRLVRAPSVPHYVRRYFEADLERRRVDFSFLSVRHPRPLVARGPLWRACSRAGISRITWHVLRHTFASHLAMRGAPLKAVQELLGHASIEMTMRYAHLSPQVGRQAVALLDLPGSPALLG